MAVRCSQTPVILASSRDRNFSINFLISNITTPISPSPPKKRNFQDDFYTSSFFPISHTAKEVPLRRALPPYREMNANSDPCFPRTLQPRKQRTGESVGTGVRPKEQLATQVSAVGSQRCTLGKMLWCPHRTTEPCVPSS